MKQSGPDPPGEVTRLRFTPDGSLVGLVGQEVITWDHRSGKELRQVAAPVEFDPFGPADFDPAGERLAFRGADGLPVVWNPKTGGETRFSIPAGNQQDSW